MNNMAWQYKSVGIEDIPFSERSRLKYRELYDRIFSLKIGEAFEIETDKVSDAANIRKSVVKKLQSKKLYDKYIAVNRSNKFYCGRIK